MGNSESPCILQQQLSLPENSVQATQIKDKSMVKMSKINKKVEETVINKSPMKEKAKVLTAVLARKCEFVYIKPILHEQMEIQTSMHTEEVYVEHPAPLEQMVESKISVSNNNNNNETTDQKNEIDRVLVQWSSFIKIKKKNYLEDYIHVKEIGQGAYGVVSKIKMKYGGMYRAAKIVKISALKKKKVGKQKFISEILIPMKTDHPNINKLFEVFEWKNQYVLIMELCEGGDLFNCIKEQKAFTESRVAEIMKQVLSGVVYLHKNNIVHRDLKPENMLYDNESQMVKITDFGTAIELPTGKKLSNVIGTPYYMAPEVLGGQYNEKCDVWSCGVILHIMLSGTPPFSGRDEAQIMSKILNQEISFSSTIWNKRSKEAKKIVMQMLTKNPSQRPSALQVLNSEWIMNSSKYSVNDLGLEAITNLKSFHFQNKLKAVVYTYIASQLYSNKDKQKLLRYFREIDQDGDGVIQKSELVAVFKKHHNKQISDGYIENILKLVDTNGSGQIDFTQFLVAASNEEELLQKQRLENAFSYLDTDHSGYITAEEIKPFLDDSEKTTEEIKQIFDEVDQNGDGRISKKQFVSLLLKKGK